MNKIQEELFGRHTLKSRYKMTARIVQPTTSTLSGVTDGGSGRAAHSGKQNVKYRPPSADILIFSILLFFQWVVVFLRFSRCFRFLASIDIHGIRIHYYFFTFFLIVG